MSKSRQLRVSFISFLKEYGIFIAIALMLICSNSLIFPGLTSLVLAFFYIGYLKFKNGTFSLKYAKLYACFLIACYVSIFAYFKADYHIIVFTVLLSVCTPFCISRKVFLLERKLIKTILLTFPIVSMFCFYCYFGGINAFNPDATFGEELDISFSAIYPHPMWLAPVAGLANVSLLWLILHTEKRLCKYLLLLFLLLSIYVTTVAASRTAFFSSLLCMCVLVIYNMKNFKRFLLYTAVIGALAYLTVPLYYSHSTQMQNKFEGGKEYQYGSRTMHFQEGLRHFQDSPFIGSGFATAWYAGNNLVLGRLESGSGWLSILFQLGVLGTIVMVLILMRVKRVLKYIDHDKTLQLFVVCTLFICLHSCFEGYLLTVGYYIGVVFWLLMGHLSVYPEMKRKYKLNFE